MIDVKFYFWTFVFKFNSTYSFGSLLANFVSPKDKLIAINISIFRKPSLQNEYFVHLDVTIKKNEKNNNNTLCTHLRNHEYRFTFVRCLVNTIMTHSYKCTFMKALQIGLDLC